MAKETEACGRCSMSVVVDAVEDDAAAEERDPFGDERIEVEESELSRVSPEAWMARVSERVDGAINRLVWK